MKLTAEQRKKIISLFPKERGNVVVDTDHVLDALMYLVHNGCTWRSLPVSFDHWHTISVRINRWAKNGILKRIFQTLRDEQISGAGLTVVGVDSTSVKVHLRSRSGKKRRTSRRDEPGRVEQEEPPDGVSSDQCAVGFIRSGGEAADAPEGRLLLDTLGRIRDTDRDTLRYLLMDRAYEDGGTRFLAFAWGGIVR